jgi:hypothetical protein
MPHRFQFLERIAFTLVVTAAVACSGFLTYEQNPDVKEAVHEGKVLMSESAKYSVVCVPTSFDPCANVSAY